MKKLLCALLSIVLISSVTAYAAPETVLETETTEETAIFADAAFAAEETVDYNAPLYGVKIGYTDFSDFTETTSVSASADIQSGSGLVLGDAWNVNGEKITEKSESASVTVEDGEKYLHIVGPINGFTLGYFIDYNAETNKYANHSETDKSLYTAITTARSNLETSGFAYRMTNKSQKLEISNEWKNYAVSHTINDEELSGSECKFSSVGYAL